jgi:hypothetical protein
MDQIEEQTEKLGSILGKICRHHFKKLTSLYLVLTFVISCLSSRCFSLVHENSDSAHGASMYTV